MAKNNITLQIRAPDRGGDILLSDFNKEVEAFTRALESADVVLSGCNARTLEFRIVDLHHSTATIEIDATPIQSSVDQRDNIANAFFAGLKEIQEYARPPRNFTSSLIDALRGLSAPVGFGIAETLITWGDRAASISVEFKKRIQDMAVPDDSESGEISGMMEMVNLHNKENKFRLFPIIGPNYLVCSFEDELLPKVKAGLGRYVFVRGIIYYRFGEKYPYRLAANDIDIPENEANLPTFESLRGIAPDLTDGLPSEVFIQRIRDEWV